MVSFFGEKYGPIGIDIGSRSVKLLQFDAARSSIWEASRWDMPNEPTLNPEQIDERIIEALHQAREGRRFRGRKAVLSLGAGGLFVQNIRVAHALGDDLNHIVRYEAAGRLPYVADEAEIRFVDVDDVRQGDALRREVILMASPKKTIERTIRIAEAAGFQPTALDAEPLALLRCHASQLRRADDQDQSLLYLHIGNSNSLALIAKGSEAMFVKYIDIGGRQFDEALARQWKMTVAEAAQLRRHNGERRTDMKNMEIETEIQNALMPTWNFLVQELLLCLRYYSVTFRGQKVHSCVLCGGEANESFAEWLGVRLDIPCDLGHSLHKIDNKHLLSRIGQWSIAAGLAMKPIL